MNTSKGTEKKFYQFVAAALLLIAASVGVWTWRFYEAQARIIYGSSQALGIGVVTSTHVLDGTLLNADVNTSAAIAWSKISKTGSKLSDIANPDLASASGTLAISQGGTGTTTAANAIRALLPSQSGNVSKYLQTDGTDASWVSLSGTTFSCTAGETLAAYDLVLMGNGATSTVKLVSSDTDSSVGFGTSADQKVRQTFRESDLAKPLNTLYVNLFKAAAPTDNVIATVYSTSSVAYASSSIAGTALTTTKTWYTLTLNSAVNAADVGWVEFARSGSFDAVNNYGITADNVGPPYAAGTLESWNGTSWGDNARDASLDVEIAYTAGTCYRTDTDDASDVKAQAIGYTNAAIANAATGTIQSSGIATNGSWALTSGARYYASSTAGAISKATSTVQLYVGRALTATTLLITSSW